MLFVRKVDLFYSPKVSIFGNYIVSLFDELGMRLRNQLFLNTAYTAFSWDWDQDSWPNWVLRICFALGSSPLLGMLLTLKSWKVVCFGFEWIQDQWTAQLQTDNLRTLVVCGLFLHYLLCQTAGRACFHIFSCVFGSVLHIQYASNCEDNCVFTTSEKKQLS